MLILIGPNNALQFSKDKNNGSFVIILTEYWKDISNYSKLFENFILGNATEQVTHQGDGIGGFLVHVHEGGS